MNEDKTKYLVIPRRIIKKQNIEVNIPLSKWIVDNLKYLCVNINAKYMHNEMNLMISTGSRSYIAISRYY